MGTISMPGKTSTRLSDALAIKEAALIILKARGSRQPSQSDGSSWKGNGVSIVLRTPFQRLPELDGRVIKQAVLYGLRPTKNLPYGLDIWELGRGKVLNLEWALNGRPELVSFKRGDWERKVLEIGTAKLLTGSLSQD